MLCVEWPPDVQYARSTDGTSLGYAVLGKGDRSVLAAIGLGTNLGIDINEEPGVVRWYERLAAIGRLIIYDQRGAGVSDPIALNELPTIEQIAEDMEAVLDAAGSDHASVVATTSLGPAAMLFAAMNPERVSALVLYGTYARMRAASDYPEGIPGDVLEGFVEFSRSAWGTGAMIQLLAPSRAGDPAYREQFARLEKLTISPTQSAILGQIGIEYDVRHILGSISTPTLVIHRSGDRFVSVAHGRYLAEHIPGARLMEVEGEDHAFHCGDVDPILDGIDEIHHGSAIGSVIESRARNGALH